MGLGVGSAGTKCGHRHFDFLFNSFIHMQPTDILKVIKHYKELVRKI
jgi:hypothetical protein